MVINFSAKTSMNQMVALSLFRTDLLSNGAVMVLATTVTRKSPHWQHQGAEVLHQIGTEPGGQFSVGRIGQWDIKISEEERESQMVSCFSAKGLDSNTTA